MDHWLLLESVQTQIAHAMKTQTAQTDFAAAEAPIREGNVAIINVKGTLTQAPDWYAAYFGGGNTTYPDIISALGAAQLDPHVDTIQLNVDSPGGSVDGLFEAMEAVAAVDKPTKVVTRSLNASAAYMLSAQADEIVAANPTARFGSVGVVVDAYVSDDVVSVTSTDAPNKRHDLKTEDGRATLRAELDDIHSIMADKIAEGRGVTAEKVNTDFGRGGMLVAAKAQAAGMIDEQMTTAAPSRDSSQALSGDSKMDLKELKAKHPETFAAARDEGIDDERERAEAHLTMGKACGDMSIAIEAIETGAGFSDKFQSKYMAAKMNSAAIESREDENVGDLNAGAAPEVISDEDKTQNATADLIEAEFGGAV